MRIQISIKKLLAITVVVACLLVPTASRLRERHAAKRFRSISSVLDDISYEKDRDLLSRLLDHRHVSEAYIDGYDETKASELLSCLSHFPMLKRLSVGGLETEDAKFFLALTL